MESHSPIDHPQEPPIVPNPLDQLPTTNQDLEQAWIDLSIHDAPIKFTFMKETMAAIWRPGKGLVVTKLAPNRFLFQLFHEVVMNRIIEGHRGGLALLWKDIIGVNIKSYFANHIDSEVSLNSSDTRWRFTGFYGVPERHSRQESWEAEALNVCEALKWIKFLQFDKVQAEMDWLVAHTLARGASSKFDCEDHVSILFSCISLVLDLDLV
nr:uncharacterized protein LOC109167502 [Ipomoea batatas]